MVSEKATRLHKEMIVIDALNISNWNCPEVIAGLHKGGVTATNATVAVWEGFEETLDTIAQWYLKFDKYADIIMPIKTVDDIKKAKSLGKSGIIFGFQNSSPIEDDLRRLRLFHELGVRVIQITYNNSNFVGAGYAESPEFGLSRFGRDFVLECNRLGILVDLSHAGDRTVMDAIEVSTKPPTFTHVGPRALFKHFRNKTDEQLKALVAKGGVVGVLGEGVLMAAGLDATLADLMESIDYIVNLVGIDHVGIGPDLGTGQDRGFYGWLFTGKNRDAKLRYPKEFESRMTNGEVISCQLKDFKSAADYPRLTESLLNHGYSEMDVKKIMGENFLRLFSEVWR